MSLKKSFFSFYTIKVTCDPLTAIRSERGRSRGGVWSWETFANDAILFVVICGPYHRSDGQMLGHRSIDFFFFSKKKLERKIFFFSKVKIRMHDMERAGKCRLNLSDFHYILARPFKIFLSSVSLPILDRKKESLSAFRPPF